jgi:hypothetical protein
LGAKKVAIFVYIVLDRIQRAFAILVSVKHLLFMYQ